MRFLQAFEEEHFHVGVLSEWVEGTGIDVEKVHQVEYCLFEL
jgi:hypothetical protein